MSGKWSAGLVLALLAGTGGYFAWDRTARQAHYREAFEVFIAKYGRSYSGRTEKLERFDIFSTNLAAIEAKNTEGRSYTLAVNEFADRLPEEVASGLARPKNSWAGLPHLGTHRYSGAELPDAVDWVAKGAVTDPKNQGQCGSCWAFSSTGALEGAWQIATGKLVSLSEQQLVDCAKNGNNGCHGGGMDQAFQYLEQHDVCTEESYAYEAKDGVCAESKCTAGIPKGGVTGFKDVSQQDTQALMEAVAKQPVSVAIEADQSAFTFYSGGVLTGECGAKLDHGVLIVGYGTDNGVDYWKVKNSWGASWGEGGYVRIKRGVPKDGECGIKDGATYPEVQAKSSTMMQAFEAFIAEHGRAYSDHEEKMRRFKIFSANLATIDAENAKSHSFTLAPNSFTDMLPDELATGLSHPMNSWAGLPHLGTHRYSGAELPDAVDWVAKGAVTDPKNQGQCGSCWSFSSTGALEGAWQIATGKLVSLSEQQLVDCAKNGNNGCHGGSMDQAFQYLEQHDVCTEESYAYEAKDGVCAETKCTAGIPKGGVTGFKDVSQQDTQALMEAVAKQPVSVAIEADQTAFQFYRGGVLTGECGAKLDHGVLIVGYGTDNGVDYWKVKNSWGASWGEGGYVRVKRGVPKDGECGIKDGPTYPLVQSSSEVAQVVV